MSHSPLIWLAKKTGNALADQRREVAENETLRGLAQADPRRIEDLLPLLVATTRAILEKRISCAEATVCLEAFKLAARILEKIEPGIDPEQLEQMAGALGIPVEQLKAMNPAEVAAQLAQMGADLSPRS